MYKVYIHVLYICVCICDEIDLPMCFNFFPSTSLTCNQVEKCRDEIAHNTQLLNYKEEASNDGERLIEEIMKINNSIAYCRELAIFYKKLIRICEDNTARNNDILDLAANNSLQYTRDMSDMVRQRRAANFETKVLNERMPQLLEALRTSENMHKDIIKRLNEQKSEMEVNFLFRVFLIAIVIYNFLFVTPPILSLQHYPLSPSQSLKVEMSFKTNLAQKRSDIACKVEVEMNEAALMKKHARRKIVSESVQGQIQNIEERAKKWHSVMVRTGIKTAEEFYSKFVNKDAGKFGTRPSLRIIIYSLRFTVMSLNCIFNSYTTALIMCKFNNIYFYNSKRCGEFFDKRP